MRVRESSSQDILMPIKSSKLLHQQPCFIYVNRMHDHIGMSSIVSSSGLFPTTSQFNSFMCVLFPCQCYICFSGV